MERKCPYRLYTQYWTKYGVSEFVLEAANQSFESCNAPDCDFYNALKEQCENPCGRVRQLIYNVDQ